jgi:hypothetical protein
MKQLDPAARVEPQAFDPVVSAKSLGLVPVMLGTMLFKSAVPVLESVAARAVDVVSAAVLGKLSVEVSEATGAAPAEIVIELLVTLASPVTVAVSV